MKYHKWGGSRYSADAQSKGWGYGEDPLSAEELLTKIVDQIEALLKIKGLQGYCYTQLADIEQEQNGLLTEKKWKRKYLLKNAVSCSPESLNKKCNKFQSKSTIFYTKSAFTQVQFRSIIKVE